ncbi:MAG: pyridoxamine 5'-phosphate oxidase family protein [Crocinitomicaceae bacterium]|nr:pyridoxamine 5'-phosphate oxidase family protein [Crocinitomicaceae bacterium]
MEIKSVSQLRDIYGFPNQRAKDKVLNVLDKHAKHFIKSSPFVVISSVNLSGKMDVSPRGGESGFVYISGDRQLIIPDYKGNNRIDSLTNIIETGHIGILFLIPGIDETLRINGKATISTSDETLRFFSTEPKLPISCIVVSIEEVFLHCAKAFMRSKLWDIDSQFNPDQFPSMGEMLKDQLSSGGKPESRVEMIERYQKEI